MEPAFKRRNLLRFSLRSFLILLTAFGIWIGVIANRAQKQKRAVQRILDLGGSVTYHHQFDAAGKRVKKATPPGPHWLREQIGSEYFDRVREVSLNDSKVTDDDLQVLSCLRDTEHLNLFRTAITDEGVQNLVSLQRLKTLNLNETRISDDGARHLLKFPSLRYVELDGLQVTDASVATFVKMPALKEISVIGTQYSESGIRKLIDTGLTVYCLLDVEFTALDQLGEPTTLLIAGNRVRTHGSFRVPRGASLKDGAFIISIIGKVSSEHPRVVYQQGIATEKRQTAELYSFGTVLDLKEPRKREVPGLLSVQFQGVDLLEKPLAALRPSADGLSSTPLSLPISAPSR